MLTIGQLAAYAGVTVRAVRHYHAKGLLPEPQRDHSGYRRYDAAAVVELIRIRTLADAGVPLSRVHELLAADGAEFAAAIDDIDRRLQAEIEDRQRHQQRVAELAAGDNLALPPEAVAYLDRLRELDVPERAITMERDAWILVAAQIPQQMSTLMALKRGQIEDPAIIAIYFDLLEAADWKADDPRLTAVADRLVTMFEADADQWSEDQMVDFDLDHELVTLLDEVFVNAVPAARPLLRLLEARGWTGWTKLERRPPIDVVPRRASSNPATASARSATSSTLTPEIARSQTC
ncbi:MAG: MerR family transcriptional regulator [Ilumatobacteraceae bacterium]|nr:MerR family transcriptional regulator [Ilumatobacteraceae bacterium]